MGQSFSDVAVEEFKGPESYLVAEVDASLKTGIGLKLDFTVNRLVGLEGILELNLLKLVVGMAVDFLTDISNVPPLPRFKKLDLTTDVEVTVNFKYFDPRALIGKDCEETCSNDCAIREDADALTLYQEECLAGCLELCDDFWVKKKLASIEFAPIQ